jgi:CheY-like chemotaxis protein
MKKIESVLIVEDDPIASLIIQKRVSANPAIRQSQIFANGELALAHIKNALAADDDLPDLILLDINMPVMDGWQFLENCTGLRKLQQVPVVMLTSSIDPEDIAKAKTFPAVKGFFSKPLTRQHLDQIVGLL